MELTELIKYVNKYTIGDPKGRRVKLDAVCRVISFEFTTVTVDDVFDLYNNLAEVVAELADDDAIGSSCKRALKEVLSYPEVTRYVSQRFEEMYSENDDDPTLSSDSDSDSDGIGWEDLVIDHIEKRITRNNTLLTCIALANLTVNLFGVYLLTRGAFTVV